MGLVLCLNVQDAGAQVINKPTVGTWYGNNPWYHPSTAYSANGCDTTVYGTPDSLTAKWSEEKISSLTLQVNVTKVAGTLTSSSTVKIYASADLGVTWNLLQTSQMADTSATQPFKYTVNGNLWTHYMIVITVADSGASVKWNSWFLGRR